VVRAEGDVACFDYERGVLARTGARFTRPTIVPGTRGATQVSVGAEHACARLESGAVRCWGTATGGRVDGQLGPARVPGT
jgi:alpha-tubulin suppressor-like RCC1 family protein